MTDDPDEKKTLADLIAVMAALRDPQTGCPWDRAQDFASIAPYTIEEAYEVADAITRGDRIDLKEELGDLLLQVVYHARLAQEEGAFAFADVVDAITRKMLRRHPHVFGSPQERAAGAAPGFWSRIKAEERAEKALTRAALGIAERPESQSLLSDVPIALPGLTRALKLQDKAARVGFDWPSLAPVFDKVREEIAELEEVARPHRDPDSDPSVDRHKVEEELGDLLFVMANVARHLDIDPEAALRRANAKFMRRFAHIEARLAETGRTPGDSDLAEMDALWNEAKANEAKSKS
ncbi:MAG: nucleoside triphosphate pyrophosphohydrolase [Hyphomicrobiaceae bacterium]|nr:nucleoside triphosphate pyrophosphohydrolase [Hyphomicrobiaceae bacterium]